MCRDKAHRFGQGAADRAADSAADNDALRAAGEVLAALETCLWAGADSGRCLHFLRSCWRATSAVTLLGPCAKDAPCTFPLLCPLTGTSYRPTPGVSNFVPTSKKSCTPSHFLISPATTSADVQANHPHTGPGSCMVSAPATRLTIEGNDGANDSWK